MIISGSNLAQDKIVEGATEFLNERASDNFVFIFESQMKQNKVFARFFPNTFEAIKLGDLRLLLTDDLLWKNCVNSDLDSLYPLTISSIFNQKIIPQNYFDRIDQFNTIAQNIFIMDDGNKYPITSLPIDRNSIPQKVFNIINSLNVEYLRIVQCLNDFLPVLKQLNQSSPAVSFSNLGSFTTFNSNVDTVIGSIESLNKLINTDAYEITGKEPLLKLNHELSTFLSSIVGVLKGANVLKNEKVSITYKVLKAFVIIDYLINYPADSINALTSDKDFANNFDKYKVYALFFSQLCDAKSSD